MIEDKPALKIQFFVSNFQNETLWIMIDYYSGLFQVLFPHSISSIFKAYFKICLVSQLLEKRIFFQIKKKINVTLLKRLITKIDCTIYFKIVIKLVDKTNKFIFFYIK